MVARVKLGLRFRDQATGYRGTATARTEYLGGRRRVLLERLDESTGMIREQWVDEDRLDLIPNVDPPGDYA